MVCFFICVEFARLGIKLTQANEQWISRSSSKPGEVSHDELKAEDRDAADERRLQTIDMVHGGGRTGTFEL